VSLRVAESHAPAERRDLLHVDGHTAIFERLLDIIPAFVNAFVVIACNLFEF
jgi:hypothetical protein